MKINVFYKTGIHLKICILFTVSVFLFTSPVHADDCLNLHVIDNRPLGFIGEDGLPTGVHWQFLSVLEKRSGICINKKLFPYPRIWKSIKFSGHDGGIVFRSQDRDSLVEYVAPILTVRTVVIPRKGITLKDYKDLKGLTIGKVRGTRLENRFDSDKAITILEVDTYEQVIQMIKTGRIDAMAGSGLGLSPFAGLDVSEYVNLPGKLILGDRVQWLQISKHSKYLDKIPKLKQTIQQLQDEGIFDSIMAQFYGPHWKDMNQ